MKAKKRRKEHSPHTVSHFCQLQAAIAERHRDFKIFYHLFQHLCNWIFTNAVIGKNWFHSWPNFFLSLTIQIHFLCFSIYLVVFFPLCLSFVFVFIFYLFLLQSILHLFLKDFHKLKFLCSFIPISFLCLPVFHLIQRLHWFKWKMNQFNSPVKIFYFIDFFITIFVFFILFHLIRFQK